MQFVPEQETVLFGGAVRWNAKKQRTENEISTLFLARVLTYGIAYNFFLAFVRSARQNALERQTSNAREKRVDIFAGFRRDRPKFRPQAIHNARYALFQRFQRCARLKSSIIRAQEQ